jgi:serine/threonine-protein kinase
MLGTPYYMSPEQVFGEKDIDGRADVWSLGVILYCALSGRRPFDGENFGQLFKSITCGEYTPLGQVARVPPELAAMVDAMLVVKRAERFGDLAMIEQSLRNCLDGRMSVPLPAGSTPMIGGSGNSLPAFNNSTGGFGGRSMQTPPPMTTSHADPPRLAAAAVAGAAGVLVVLAIGVFAGVHFFGKKEAATPPAPTQVVVTATPPVESHAAVIAPIESVAPTPTTSTTAAASSTGKTKPTTSTTSTTTTTTPSSTATHSPGGLSTAVPF